MSNKTITTGSGSQIIIYQAEDGNIKIDVRLENETVWLTQKLMAELFQVGVNTINYHIKEIFNEDELTPEATIRKFRIVQKEGNRDVARHVDAKDFECLARKIESNGKGRRQ